MSDLVEIVKAIMAGAWDRHPDPCIDECIDDMANGAIAAVLNDLERSMNEGCAADDWLRARQWDLGLTSPVEPGDQDGAV